MGTGMYVADSLLLVLLEDDAVELDAALVERVEALAEADDALAGLQAQREADPLRPVIADEPLDAARLEPPRRLDTDLRDGELAGRLALPARDPEVEPPRPPAVGEEAIADAPRGWSLDDGRPREPIRAPPRTRGDRGEMTVAGAERRRRVLGHGRALGRRVDDGRAAVRLELHAHRLDARRRRRAQLHTLAREGLDRHPLVGLHQVRVATPRGPVPNQASASVMPSSDARVRNIACDQRSGEAIGPQRCRQPSYASGTSRCSLTCSGRLP